MAKNLKKIIFSALLAGTVTITLLKGSIFSNFNRRPELNNESDAGNSLLIEPDIETESNYDAEIGPILPGLQNPMPEIDDKVEDVGVEFVDVLAQLTNMCRDYSNVTLGGTSNLTVVGISTIQADSNTGKVSIIGQIEVNGGYKNFVATASNGNTSLDIFNLSSEISETQLSTSLMELLSDEHTEFKFSQKESFKLSNQRDVIDNILIARLEQLEALNSTDSAILNEIKHINNIIKGNSNASLSVLFNERSESENGYNYSFNISVNTGKYLYTVEQIVSYKRVLSSTALKHALENTLDSTTDYQVSVATISEINSALDLINNTANALEEQNLTQ